MKPWRLISIILILFFVTGSLSARIFIPMGATGQANHLKAYGITYAAIQKGLKVEWLLNYQGGSFVIDDDPSIERLCTQRGVSYTQIADQQYKKIIKEISDPQFNGTVVALERVPKIAVYTPSDKMPWDDAVTLALTYAGIPFDKLYAGEVLHGDLDKYDWLHLFHEDFTGQYSRFWLSFRDSLWYRHQKRSMESLAAKNGYKKVSQMQLAVVKKIRDFVTGGGNLFAMCSATETFDIALSAARTDICDTMFDGDPVAPDALNKIDYSKCLAFRNFYINTNIFMPGFSNINNAYFRSVPENLDFFTIVSPPAKQDVVPVMLCQNHVREIAGFMGQTTSFRKDLIKPDVMILGERAENNEARYIHGECGKGSWTFLGGHDPEDYQHLVNDPPTDLSHYPNSPGYRLILNNVLFPAVKKTYVPTVVVNSTTHKEDNINTAYIAQARHIKLQPDMTRDELIVTTDTGKIQRVIISNISGKELINRTFNSEKANVDINSLAPGIYMVNVNGEYIGKMVKN